MTKLWPTKPNIYNFHKKQKECDFIIRNQGKINQAIQVTSILKESNREREIEGLLEALHEHKLNEGLIITEDQSEELRVENKKIVITPIWRWLLENEE